jgi:hypothetical protein
MATSRSPIRSSQQRFDLVAFRSHDHSETRNGGTYRFNLRVRKASGFEGTQENVHKAMAVLQYGINPVGGLPE